MPIAGYVTEELKKNQKRYNDASHKNISPAHERFMNGVFVDNDVIICCSVSLSSSSLTSHQLELLPGPETAPTVTPALTSVDDVDATVKVWCCDRSSTSLAVPSLDAMTSSIGSGATPSGLFVTSASALLGDVNHGESMQPSFTDITWTHSVNVCRYIVC